MDKTELKKTIVELYAEYKKVAAKRSAEVEKDKKDARLHVPATFDGFMEWLESGEVK